MDKKIKRDADETRSRIGVLLTDGASRDLFASYLITPRERVQALFYKMSELVEEYAKIKRQEQHGPFPIPTLASIAHDFYFPDGRRYDVRFKVEPKDLSEEMPKTENNNIWKLAIYLQAGHNEVVRAIERRRTLPEGYEVVRRNFHSQEDMLKYFEKFILKQSKKSKVPNPITSLYKAMALPFEGINDRVTNPGPFRDDSNRIKDEKHYFAYKKEQPEPRYYSRVRYGDGHNAVSFNFSSGIKGKVSRPFVKIASQMQRLANSLGLGSGLATILNKNISAGALRRSRKKKLSAGASRETRKKKSNAGASRGSGKKKPSRGKLSAGASQGSGKKKSSRGKSSAGYGKKKLSRVVN